MNHLFFFTPQQIDNIICDLFRVGRRQINFVEYRYNLQVIFECQIQIRNGLRLNTLCSIYDKQRTLTSCNGSRNLIGKINVTRGVDEIKHILLTIQNIIHLNGVRLDCDTSLTLQIHIIKKLILFFTLSNSSSSIEQTIGQSAFTMVNMGNNAKITNVLHLRTKRITKILNCTLQM